MHEIDAFSDFLLGENCSKATIDSYTRTIRQFLQVVHKKPSDITKEDIYKYKVHAVKVKNYQINSLISKYSAINRYMEFLEKPLKIDLPKKEVKNKIPFTRDEIQRIFDVSRKNPRDYAILMTLYYTQLRRNELRNLHIDDVDFERRKIRVNKGKGNDYSTINIHPDALDSIREYLKVRGEANKGSEHILFLSTHGNKLSICPIAYLVKKYAGKAGITKRVYPHLFRISSITHMAENGCNLEEIRRQSRHADYKTLQGYIQLSEEHVRESYMRGLSFKSTTDMPKNETTQETIVHSDAYGLFEQKLVQKLLTGEITSEAFNNAVSLLGHKSEQEKILTGYY